MEGAAIAHAAYLNHISCVIIRAISDKADNSATMDYPTFEKQAIKHSVKLVALGASALDKLCVGCDNVSIAKLERSRVLTEGKRLLRGINAICGDNAIANRRGINFCEFAVKDDAEGVVFVSRVKDSDGGKRCFKRRKLSRSLDLGDKCGLKNDVGIGVASVAELRHRA